MLVFVFISGVQGLQGSSVVKYNLTSTFTTQQWLLMNREATAMSNKRPKGRVLPQCLQLTNTWFSS